MKMKKYFALILGFLFVINPTTTIFAESSYDNGSTNDSTKENYLITVENTSAGETLCKNYDAVAINDEDNVYAVELTNNQFKYLNKKDYVLELEDDIVLNGSGVTDDIDCDFNQWYLDAIGVENTEKFNENVKIEILDSGIDYSDNYSVVESVDLVNDSNESSIFNDNSGHGTAIAGVIASEDDNEFSGINPNAQIYSVKALDYNNQAPLSRIIEGIYWGIDNDIDIINMSFGTNVDSSILHNAIQEANRNGILLIAAAGNSNHLDVQYPAAYDEVLSVGSVNSQGVLSELTSVGEMLDILAPGENIATVGFIDTVSSVSGTSIATAQVTAVASLLWAKDKSKTNDFIKELLCSTTNKPDSLEELNVGVVNYKNALTNYDEFEKNYSNKQQMYDFNTNESFDYSDVDTPIVNALWLNTTDAPGHDELSTESAEYASFSGNAPKISRYACTHTDGLTKIIVNNEKLTVGAPHGTGNYVINLRYLYKMSRCIYENGVGDESKNLNKYFSDDNVSWDVNGNSSNASYNKGVWNILRQYVNYNLTNYSLLEPSIKKNFNSYSKETQNRYLGLMIYGIALHLTGDIYAHKTIVPKYTVAGVNPKQKSKNSDGKMMFGAADFPNDGKFSDTTAVRNAIKSSCLKNHDLSNITDNIHSWQACQLGVSMQVVEFRDINAFLISTGHNVYEDYTDFCNERYKAAMLACKRMSKRFKEGGTFYTKLIYPKYYNSTDSKNKPFKTVKLNNFKDYAKSAGLDVIGVDLDNEDWNVNSTTVLV